ncbi:MAG: SH3 domain-containing protein [Eubacteriales bacterium]|nr:SH3 domain-containing protein [Eubacteriales bacterium]
MDNIREWISDNLRYIILGAALILILLIAVFGVRAITRRVSGGSKKPEVTQEAETTANSDVIVESEGADGTTSALVENDTAILTMMTSYYSAKTNKDIATIKKLDPSIDETAEKANLENSYVESYSNIRTYSVQGATEGTYVVYVCYNGKVQNIDTEVPSLTQFYLRTDADGNLYISNPAGDAAAEAYIEEMRKSTAVQQLIEQVEKACKEATDGDAVLKEFMSKYGSSSGSTQEDTTGSNAETTAASSEVMAIEDQINVRSEPSTDGDILGTLAYGEVVIATGGETEEGWVEIEYNGATAYVSSDFVGPAETASEDTDTAAENTGAEEAVQEAAAPEAAAEEAAGSAENTAEAVEAA